jgi:transposase
VDLETGAIVAVTLQEADQGDTTTIQTTLPEAIEQLEAVAAIIDDKVKTGKEVVTDKGYHSKQTVLDMQNVGLRTYISEPDRGRQHWKGQHAERDAVYANRRRIRGERGQQLMRLRGELLERPNAHLYETGGMRRIHLRGHGNILKRLLVHVAAANLGLWMRTLTGIGTPRGLQGRRAAAWAFCFTLWVVLHDRVRAIRCRGLDLRLFAIPTHRFALIPYVM